MSKIELFILISLGFLIFTVLFIRLGFFFGVTINSFTLIFSFITYCLSLSALLLFMNLAREKLIRYLFSLLLFIIGSFIIGAISLLLSFTYDISWDGQGYHQTAVIALADNWNPIYEESIQFSQKLPSQIFAEGYPSALWELEASVYSLTGKINSAKIFNIAIILIAALLVYSLLRKLLFGKIMSLIIAALIVIQPIYVLQMLTFMQDGFGYELLVIAVSSLTIAIITPKSYWALLVFIMAEVMLVSTKYSHLPVALILGIIFIIVLLNRYMNRQYVFNKSIKLIFSAIIITTLIFAYLPYVRNQLFHNAPFYPTNITELMGSVTYNNVPLNLSKENKFNLLFYGIFSKSQPKESGDPRSKENIAQLKIPFTMSINEIKDAGGHFNNRVGAGGPLFSGVVILSFIFLVITSFRTKNVKQRYAIYAGYFSIAVILLLSLLAPTPNLLRYVNQLQLLPFVIIIPIYTVFKNIYARLSTFVILFLIAINISLFSAVVVEKNLADNSQINRQFKDMRNSKSEYMVRAQQFYSSYIILNEQKIPFKVSDKLICEGIKEMVVSSTTTQYCEVN